MPMARRHDTLIPLTHDHHHALAQARRLEEAAELEERPRLNAANDFLNFYFGRAVRHFHEEEELFFAPLVDEPEARDLVLRAVSDHLRIHALAREVPRSAMSFGGRSGLALRRVRGSRRRPA